MACTISFFCTSCSEQLGDAWLSETDAKCPQRAATEFMNLSASCFEQETSNPKLLKLLANEGRVSWTRVNPEAW